MCLRLATPGVFSGDVNRFVRTNVASRITGVPTRTLRYWARTRRVDAYRQGRRHWLFRLGALLSFIGLN
jgi:hypothetical protein